jgi:3-oxoacyl-[acyl-carrier protein] reductase
MVTEMRFDGKVAVVTGASRGIGRAIALALAGEGCKVVVNYEKNRDKANEVVEAIRRTKAEAIAAKCDVSVRNEVEAMFKTIIDEFGKVDILVNNAAIGIAALLLETTDELWERTLNVNLKGVFLCTQVAAKYMIQKRYGKIVNIASNSAFGIAVWGETAYAASKAGVMQLTKTAAFELGQYGINVNCVAPGAVDTDMLKGDMSDQQYAELVNSKKAMSSLGTIGKPKDIANAVLFFASDASHFITGKTLLVDGGRRDFI